MLDELHPEFNRTNSAAWNTPASDSVYPNFKECGELSCYRQDGPIVLPIGAVIPMPNSSNNSVKLETLEHWSRITLVAGFDSDSDEGWYIKLYLKDILCLWKKTNRQRRKSVCTTITVYPSNLIQRPLKSEH